MTYTPPTQHPEVAEWDEVTLTTMPYGNKSTASMGAYTGGDGFWVGNKLYYLTCLTSINVSQMNVYDKDTDTTTTPFPAMPWTTGSSSCMATDGTYLYVFRGLNTTDWARAEIANPAGGWTTLPALPVAVTNGSACASGGGYIYLLSAGTGAQVFKRYNFATETWEDLVSPSVTGSTQEGNDLAYVNHNGTEYVFLAIYPAGFHRYNIATDTWTTVTAPPSTFNGAYPALEAKDGNTIFATRAPNSFDWLSYDVASDTWSQMNSTNGHAAVGLSTTIRNIIYYAPENQSMFIGATLNSVLFDHSLRWFSLLQYYSTGVLMTATDAHVYLVARDNAHGYRRLYRIDKETGEIAIMSPPDLLTWTDQNAALCWDGNDTIYFIVLTTGSSFAAYTISTDTWTLKATSPLSSTSAAQLLYDTAQDKLWLFSASNRADVYDPTLNTWTPKTSLSALGVGLVLDNAGIGNHLGGSAAYGGFSSDNSLILPQIVDYWYDINSTSLSSANTGPTSKAVVSLGYPYICYMAPGTDKAKLIIANVRTKELSMVQLPNRPSSLGDTNPPLLVFDGEHLWYYAAYIGFSYPGLSNKLFRARITPRPSKAKFDITKGHR